MSRSRLCVAAVAFFSLSSAADSSAQGLDLDRFCKSKGFQGVTNVDNTGYGWRCVTPGQPIPTAAMPVDQVCKEQYGPQASARLKTPPPGGPGDWVCDVKAPTSSADAAIEEDVNWCLGRAANQTIAEQSNAINRGYCQAILAGTVLSGLYEHIKNKRQNEWSRDAAPLACDTNPTNQAIAVAAIAACQCHNEGRARRILDNRITVIHALRRYARCDNLGLPIY